MKKDVETEDLKKVTGGANGGAIYNDPKKQKNGAGIGGGRYNSPNLPTGGAIYNENN